MKYLKPFNENTDNFKEELKDFCETGLAYLLDDGGEVKIYHDRIVIISVFDRYDESVYSPKTWSQLKDHLIPFLIRLTNKYEINTSYYSGFTQDNMKKDSLRTRFFTDKTKDIRIIADSVKHYRIKDLVKDEMNLDSIGKIEEICFNVDGYKQEPKKEKGILTKIKSFFK
jgi:hypothetical protein